MEWRVTKRYFRRFTKLDSHGSKEKKYHPKETFRIIETIACCSVACPQEESIWLPWSALGCWFRRKQAFRFHLHAVAHVSPMSAWNINKAGNFWVLTPNTQQQAWIVREESIGKQGRWSCYHSDQNARLSKKIRAKYSLNNKIKRCAD